MPVPGHRRSTQIAHTVVTDRWDGGGAPEEDEAGGLAPSESAP